MKHDVVVDSQGEMFLEGAPRAPSLPRATGIPQPAPSPEQLLSAQRMTDQIINRLVSSGDAELDRLIANLQAQYEADPSAWNEAQLRIAAECRETRQTYRPCASKICLQSATYRVHAPHSVFDCCPTHAEPHRKDILSTVEEIAR